MRPRPGTQVRELRFWDLLISTVALAQVARWVSGYRALGRADVTVALGTEHVRGFARAALERG